MALRPGQGCLLLFLLLSLARANAGSVDAGVSPGAGSISATALPMGIECPVQPGDPRRVRVAWERTNDGIRSLVISPTGRVLIASSWVEPVANPTTDYYEVISREMVPSFTCRASSIDVSLSPEKTIPLVIEDGGERVVPDPRPLRALLDSLWRERPGSAVDRARTAERLLFLYLRLLGKPDDELDSEVLDLLRRERLWSGVKDKQQRFNEDVWRFSPTPRGRKLLDEYWVHLRKSAGIPFQLRLEKELGFSYFADVNGHEPFLYWEGASFCVAQADPAHCDPAGTCKGRDEVRCYDVSAGRWGPKRKRGDMSRTSSAAPGDSLRGQRYHLDECDFSRLGAQVRTGIETVLRPLPKSGEESFECSRTSNPGLTPESLLFSEDGRFAVLVVRDKKLLGYDCPPGRISCSGFEEWDVKYPLRLYSVVFDP